MTEKQDVKVPASVAFAAILCSVSLISSMLTGIAYLGSVFPSAAAWLFGLSIASTGAAILLGLGLAFTASLEPRKKIHPPGD